MKDDLDDFLGVLTKDKKDGRQVKLEGFIRDVFRSRISGTKANDVMGLRAVLGVKEMVEARADEYEVYEIMPLVYTSDKTVSGQYKITWMDGTIEWVNYNVILKPTVKISVRFE